VDYYQRQIIAWLAILVGAFFLAKSVARRREKGQMRDLLGLPTDKVKRFRNFFVQRLERIVGFVFILVGVGIHLYVVVRSAQKGGGGTNDPREAFGEISTYLAIASITMLLITAAMHWICSYFARRIFLDILGYYMVRQGYNLEDDPRLMTQIGEMLGLERSPEDSVESYRERLEKGLRLDTVRARLLARGKLDELEDQGHRVHGHDEHPDEHPEDPADDPLDDGRDGSRVTV